MIKKAEVSLKAHALRYLSVREYSTKDLRQKLQQLGSPQEEIEALIEWLLQQGFLSDQRFVESYIHRRASKYGNLKVIIELQQHGIEPELIEGAKQLLEDSELLRAKEVWQKKFGQRAISLQEKAKQIRFLAQRGFNQKVIRTIIEDFED